MGQAESTQYLLEKILVEMTSDRENQKAFLNGDPHVQEFVLRNDALTTLNAAFIKSPNTYEVKALCLLALKLGDNGLRWLEDNLNDSREMIRLTTLMGIAEAGQLNETKK